MIDWQQIFIPTNSIFEVIVRGTCTYVMLFLILRFLLKRQTGVIGVADLLVIVLIADAAQNAMANEYKSITEGAILVLTIVFWNFAIDWLGYRFPVFQRLTRPPPLTLIENGKMLVRNMQQEMITTDGAEQPASPARDRALLRGQEGLHRRRRLDQRHPQGQGGNRSGDGSFEGNRLIASPHRRNLCRTACNLMA